MPDRLLEDGEHADFPGWRMRAVHTPGHTPGHLCFAEERTGLFFSGDHVLPRISPNIAQPTKLNEGTQKKGSADGGAHHRAAARSARAAAPGGAARRLAGAVERHRERGKLLARERVELLLDPGSFVELDASSSTAARTST